MADELRNETAGMAAAADPFADLEVPAAPSLSFGEPEAAAAVQEAPAPVAEAVPEKEPEEAILTPEEMKGLEWCDADAEVIEKLNQL